MAVSLIFGNVEAAEISFLDISAGGEIVGDETARRPMSRRGIVLSAALLLALSLSWAARSWIKEIRQ